MRDSSVSYNFIPCQEVEQREGTNFFYKTLSKYVVSGIEELQFEHAQILYLDLELRNCPLWKFY